MSQKIVCGLIDQNGDIKRGSGFSVVHDDTGEYTILFDKNTFSEMPAVVTTQNYHHWDDFGDGGNTLDNTVLVGITNEKFKVKTGGASGDAKDRNFTFIAIGNSEA